MVLIFAGKLASPIVIARLNVTQDGWSEADKCPLNVCCSEFGFCGTTEEFCGNKTVTAPSCDGGSSSSKRTIGYYESWSLSRNCDRVYPEAIPIGSYTHLNFAFAFIDPLTFKVAPMNEGDPELYKRFTGLKSLYPDLQTWISIGGWSMNDADQPTATTFSDLAASKSVQKKFFASLLSFMETYNFDGVDLDWEYPVAEERSGREEDFDNFTSLLQNLRDHLSSSGKKYGLTITIPTSYWYLRHFDIANMEKIVDWFNIMSYDLHGTWDNDNQWTGPYVRAHTNLTEINTSLELLWRNDINPEKVVLGLGFYGRSFTLQDPGCKKPGCIFSAGGNAGDCTGSVGTLSYAEIEKVIENGADMELDHKAAVKLVTWGGDQWVSYDDSETLKLKLDYANDHCLGGTMVWATSQDDSKGTASAALSKLTGRSALALSARSTSTTDQVQSCRLGECGKKCPSGLKPAQRSDGKNKGNTGTNTGCPDGENRLYCCPPDNMPTCRWRGTAPFCKGKCHDGEVEVSSSMSGTGASCWTGHKVLCCEQTAANKAVSECKWTGSAPSCAGLGGKASCPDSQKRLTYSNYGAGGEQPCFTGSKSLCCDQPPPYENCDWYYHGGKILGQIPFKCTGTCPAGKASIATDPTGCLTGYGSFCCDSPATTNDPRVSDFSKRLEGFAKNPTCGKDDRLNAKREEKNVQLSKRHDLSKSDWSDLLMQITALAAGTARTYQMTLMAQEYNTSYAADIGLDLDQIAEYHADWPNTDSVALTQSLMCLGKKASDTVDDYQEARSEVCINRCPSASTKRQSVEGFSSSLPSTNISNHLGARRIDLLDDPQPGGGGYMPTWTYMIQAIMDGEFKLLYEQLIYTNRGEQILEIAWELPSGRDGDSYRESSDDQYVVFHFHFDHLVDFEGTDYAGIYAMVAFHGQRRGRMRIEGNDHTNANARARLIECDPDDEGDENTLYWYPGDNSIDAESQWGQWLTDFGVWLHQQDLITARTFTGSRRGQLSTYQDENSFCPERRLFDWNGYHQSRQFTPGGESEGERTDDEDDQNDNDGV
ncbi:hypothetical protein SI65_08986 [Aspergillus cristatus]|uniref:chitinase n=1 Tax=Aspergillus cristatus TaxID=573508 RepID=A0A1E3B473_ASPCR|nr:hypothetical protein SI65_08986 [Aspergillus cristatus]